MNLSFLATVIGHLLAKRRYWAAVGEYGLAARSTKQYGNSKGIRNYNFVISVTVSGW
jgi:hypothetical protein